ncbi:UNVERIFIED_CONTAM: hypothetical protein Cloal_2112 [Acetivibrio alkalicellulosi]
MFIGRESELKYLEKLYLSNKFEFAVMYGRRRVGKTTLLTEFCKGKSNIFFVAEEHSKNVELEKFSKVVLRKFGLDNVINKFDSFENLFMFLAEKSKNERLILVIDEFQYLANSNKNLLSMLQNLIDHNIKETQLFLIICGSSVSFMENEVLAYKSPLYGRRTAQFEIEPFEYYTAIKLFDNYTAEDKIIAYSILGGTPQYLLQFDPFVPIDENIKNKTMTKFSYLYEEPKNLLKQELREPSIYNSIIEAIAKGYTKLNQISTKIGEPIDKTYIYMKTLIELRIIEKILPVTDKANSRNSFYKLKDNMFRFAYKFLYSNIEFIEQEEIEFLWKEIIKPNMNEYLGHVFEDICMEYLKKENKARNLPFVFKKIGKWWGNNKIEKRQEEIDILAFYENKVIYGECKYKNEKMSTEVYFDLKRKSELINIGSEKYYYLFSKSGFDNELIDLSKKDTKIKLVDLMMIVS